MNNAEKLWIMKLCPPSGINSFESCRKKKVVGFGWGIGKQPKDITYTEYAAAAKAKYKGYRGITQLLNGFQEIVDNPGKHLIWVMDFSTRVFYLCAPTGEYRYSSNKRMEQAGIVNTISCEFHKIGFKGIVPNIIANGFATKTTLRKIEDENALYVSKCFLELIKNDRLPK